MEKSQQKYLSFFIDLLVISIIFFFLLYFKYQDWFEGLNPIEIGKFLLPYQLKSYLFLLLSWFLISQYLAFYKAIRFERFIDYIRKSIFQTALFSFVLFAISGVKNEDLFSNKESLIFVLLMACYVLLSRSIIFFVKKRYRTQGLNSKNIIILGCNSNVNSLIKSIHERKDFGLRLIHHFTFDKNEEFNLLHFEKTLLENKINYLYISLNDGLNEEVINQVSLICEKNFISVGFIPDAYGFSTQNLELTHLDTNPILVYGKMPLDHTFNQIIKRTFDIIFTLTVFVFLLSWLLPIIALAVYFSQGGPILFAQKRNGLNGKEFNCLKFRTMRPDKDNNKKPTERDDPRVTKLGKILRKTSLDELPQFFNVLKGEMSIVGPRPHMVSENEAYSEIINRYALRHYVKPGITGLAQVRGHRGAVDSHKDMEMRIRTDIYYVRNWSFLLDLLIIYQTAKLMVFGDENAI